MAERTFRAAVDQVDGNGLAEELRQRLLDGARAAADEIVREHVEALRAGASPLGGPQKPNSPGTSKRKGGRPPLVDTGRLLRGLRVVEHPDGVTIVPPPDRVGILDRLHDDGYETVFSGEASDFADTVHDEVADEVSKFDTARHVRRTRL